MAKKKSKKPEIPEITLSHQEYQKQIQERKEKFEALLNELDKVKLENDDFDAKIDQVVEEKYEIEKLVTNHIIEKVNYILKHITVVGTLKHLFIEKYRLMLN